MNQTPISVQTNHNHTNNLYRTVFGSMVSINNQSIINSITKYLNAYKTVFYKRSFHNFQIVIIAMLYMQEIRSIKLIYDKFIKKHWNICLNRFYYFLSEKNFNISELAIATLGICLKFISNELKNHVTIYLIIDDTLQSKFGTKFDCYSKLFDHTNKNGSSYLSGHCFVSLAIAIPILYNQKFHYIKIPIQYKLYDKTKSKLELAANMVSSVAPTLADYQVIVTCDSWYTKAPFLKVIKQFENIDVIGALRSDTAMFDINVEPRSGKRGRPRKKGAKIDYHNLKYTEEGKFYISHTKAKVNITDDIVYITVTTTDIDKFSSIRLYMSTINPDNIKSFESISNKDGNELKKTTFNIYKIRWNIEVIFYQQKTFWSFGNYMVRSKEAIEKYVNLLGVTYSLCILLPFINSNLSQYKFASPQEIKYYLSECIAKELIFDKLLKTLQLAKNISTAKDVIDFIASHDGVS